MAKWFKPVAIVGAVAVAVVGLGAATLAPAFADGGGQPGLAERFVAKLAANLGVGEDQLRSAIKTTRTQLVDEAVAGGRLTPEQAERARQRIEQGRGFGPRAGMPERRGAGPRGQRGPGAMTPGGFTSVAQLLGLTPAQLRAELAGKSLAQVGEAHGKSRDEVGEAFVQGVRADLDRAVAAGRLTRERADQMLERLQQNLNTMLDRQVPQRGGPGPRGQRGPGAMTPGGFTSVAQLLDLTPAQLRAELAGKSLAQVGEAQGKSRDEVGQAFVQGVRADLDRAVAAGRLTRERADQMLERVQQNLNTMLDRQFPQRRRP